MKTGTEYFKAYAKHNIWANGLLMEKIDLVPDEKYYTPLFPDCRSMHQILNHMIAMDELWLAEMKQEKTEITSGTQILYEDRGTFKEARQRVDDAISVVIDELDAEMIESVVEYPDGLNWPLYLEVAHVFRHQIHHRGQLSILIASAGAEMPKLDQMFLPT